MDKEEFSEPTRAARMTGIALIVCGVLSLLMILPVSHWYVHTLENIQDPDQSRLILVASSSLPAILFAALTSWLMALGHSTITLKYWPPAGLPILYRTRKYSGNQATINGVVCFLAGGFTGLIAIFWFYMAWVAYNL